MKKIAFFLLLLSLQLTAFENLTEARVGYFIPTDAQFRHNYGQDGIISSLESSFNAGRNFWPWVNISYYGNASHPDAGGGKKSHIYMIPVGAGLKYLYFFKHFGVYGGLGVLPTYLHIENNSPLLVRTQQKWGCGGVAKGGVISNRLWNFFLDLFAEYSYIKIPFHNDPDLTLHPANLSHFTIGGGIGYHFGPCSSEDEDDNY
ncbi:MAG TPA: hypothetical protein VLF94_01070 [Chlamydiales bacterium]|nr:hypothetical protein [Chlamydiales bacterium]